MFFSCIKGKELQIPSGTCVFDSGRKIFIIVNKGSSEASEVYLDSVS